jgi:acyl dehydratase
VNADGTGVMFTESPRALAARIGEEVAVTAWVDVTQTRIDQFAEATGDRQWIHLDADRARRESPFGTTIAHGFLTLSLLATLADSVFSFRGLRLAVNYGLNRVRFVSAVPAGARVRGRFSPINVAPVEGGVQVTWQVVVDRDGADKPSCTAEWIVRYILND